MTAHLHRQNQVAHALRTRDFWLASLSMHFPIHFGQRAHEYPVTLTTPTHQGAFNSHGSLPTIARLDREKFFTARNGGPTGREDCFLSPFGQRRREMAHPAPTKSFSRPSPEAAMLPKLSAETHPPPPVLPSLLAQSLSPTDTARSLTALSVKVLKMCTAIVLESLAI